MVEAELEVYFTQDRGGERKIYNVASVLNPEYRLALYDDLQSRHDSIIFKDQLESYLSLILSWRPPRPRLHPKRQTTASDLLAQRTRGLKIRRGAQAYEKSRYLAEGKMAL